MKGERKAGPEIVQDDIQEVEKEKNLYSYLQQGMR